MVGEVSRRELGEKNDAFGNLVSDSSKSKSIDAIEPIVPALSRIASEPQHGHLPHLSVGMPSQERSLISCRMNFQRREQNCWSLSFAMPLLLAGFASLGLAADPRRKTFTKLLRAVAESIGRR